MHPSNVYSLSKVECYQDVSLHNFSSFILHCMLRGSLARAKTWCHIFISLFPFQKEKLQLILIFLQAQGRRTFYVCERMAHPPSHMRTVPPRNTCLLQLMPVQIESWGSGDCSSNGPPFYNIHSPPV